MICKCGHAWESHREIEEYISEYCNECWAKRWTQKYRRMDFIDLPFEICTNYKADNLKYLESLIND